MKNCLNCVKTIVVGVVVALSFGLMAETQKVNDYTWSYTIKDGKATIESRIGGGAVSPSPTGALEIPSFLGGCPVTGIGDYAFVSCEGLTSVTIPTSVTCIGKSAFSSCFGLTSVTIPSSVTSIGERAFSSCEGLTSVTVPSSVTNIVDYTFYHCDSLTSVTIPSSVTCIGDYAFYSCDSLTSVTIPSSVTRIGDCAFYGCDGLTSVTIPSSVTSIGESAFSSCEGLTSVTVPSSVTSIGESVFAYCYSLASVTIPSSVTRIGDYAFCCCDGLTSVTIPSSVTRIGDYAFYGCGGLTSVTIPSSVTYIGDNAFGGIDFSSVVGDFKYTYRVEHGKAVITLIANADGHSATTLRMPSMLDGFEVYEIDAYVLSDDLSVVDIVLPDSLKIIGSHAFSCYGFLSHVTLNEGIESIGYLAFWSSGLAELHIPSSVTNLQEGVFAGAFHGGHTPVTIDAGNVNYVVVDGCVYDVDMKTLVFCPPTHENIDIPESVEVISAKAFHGCDMIRELSFGRNIREIRDPINIHEVGPLISTYSLERIYVSEDNPYYSSFEGSLYNKDKTSLVFCPLATEELRLPATVCELDSWLLHYNSNMKWYAVEPGNQKYDAFDGCLYDKGCRNLLAIPPCRTGNVALPASMVGPADLSELIRSSSMDSFTVEEGNETFEAQDGSLYDKGRKTLIFASRNVVDYFVDEPVERIGADAFYHHGNLETVAFADSVKCIGEEAFCACFALRQVDMGKNVETIEGYAFWQCPFGKIVLPATLKNLGSHVFYSCGSLRSVYFCGNAPELDEDGETSGMFLNSNAGLKVYVMLGTTGWDGILGSDYLPGMWPMDDEYARPLVVWDGTLPERPMNDDFANATALTGVSGSITAMNDEATPETGEPLLRFSSNSTKTIWWKWLAPANGSVVFNTVGSDFDTLMGIYKGDSLSSLVAVSLDDDGGGNWTSQCSFECVAGTTYYVCVSGRGGDFGCIILNWEFTEREIEVDPTPVDPAPVDPTPVDPAPVDPIVEQRVLYREVTSGGDGAMPYTTAAGVYDGYLRDDYGNITGTIQMKVAKGKIDKKTGEFAAKVTATVIPVDGSKKISFKGGFADEHGNVTGLTASGHRLDVTLGTGGLSGSMDGKSVDGTRNFFAAKDASAKTLAAVAERAWVGAVNVVADGVVLTVSIAKKGKVKITGTVDGTKVSVKSQLLVGDAFCCIPVVITKKANLAFNLWLMSDGSVEVAGLDGALAAKAGALKTGAKFTLGLGGVLPGVFEEYLPNGLTVAANSTKWVVAGGAKAGKPKLGKGTTTIDQEKSKFTGNMSGLKLSYKAKDGSFKGSFKAFAIENGKLKSYSVTVIGVMVGDVGYGTATIKKPVVSWPVTIE